MAKIDLDELKTSFQALKKEIGKVIIGQEEAIEKLIITLLAKGHALMVGVPGLAKTLVVSTISEVLSLTFNRIQFTPDLMPSDITGSEILEEDQVKKNRKFKFVKGPVFANVILADEINRTPPKTQAALLEAMQEKRITSGGFSHDLPNPFLVLATQNPVEQEGTYPLPEAQLDRFMFTLNIGYPSDLEEIEIVKRTTVEDSQKLSKIWELEKILLYQRMIREMPVSQNVIEYAVSLSRETRPIVSKKEMVKKYVTWGAGPRASQYLILASKAKALISGKNTPSIEDVREMALSVLQHRIITSFAAEAEGVSQKQIIDALLL